MALATEHKDVVEEHLAVLSEVCEGLCGQGFPHELGMVVLIEHGGMRAPSAAAFWGERRMWEWVADMERNFPKNTTFGSSHRAEALSSQCVCGMVAVQFRPMHAYKDALSSYGRAKMTKQMACHQARRLSNVTERWVAEGPWKRDSPSAPLRVAPQCSMNELWGVIWTNTSAKLTTHGETMRVLLELNRGIRFREGLLEREFLWAADRPQIREAIAKVNGTEVVKIKGDDYTSRNEWVRIYYNSLREKPLHNWPYADD